MLLETQDQIKKSFLGIREGNKSSNKNGKIKNSQYQFNPISANPTKSSNTLKQFVGFFWSAFDYFVGLALKGLIVT